MERNNDSKHNKNSEPEAEGIPPVPRQNSGVKMSPKVATPAFRFAALDTRPPAAAGFMSPSQYSKPFSSSPSASPDVSAHFDEDDGPTRSVARAVASMPSLKPFGISKEHVVPNQFYQMPKSVSDSRTVPVFDIKQQAKPLKNASWNSPSLDKLPRYYPLERTKRHIKLEECSFDKLLSRLSDGFRMMSIQAKYFNRPASAALLTPENVELYLVLWESDDCKDVIVEVQRRRGDTTIFHHYANHILDAASGNLDPSLFANTEGSLLYLQSTEKLLRSELSRVAPECDLDKEAVVALEIVSDLLKKDRRDARQLGMEGVCIMTNARKTVLPAAILTSRAILLGDRQFQASQDLHEIILDIIQKRSVPGEDEVMGGEDPYDSDDEQYFLDEDEEMRDYSPEYKEEMTLLFNLALASIAHALEVVTTFGIDSSPEASFSAAEIIDTFLANTDLLATFLHTIQRSYLKPHNAWLAAKCLRFICTASPSATERTRNLGGPQFVANAFEVGVSCHAKLETECRYLQSVLTTC